MTVVQPAVGLDYAQADEISGKQKLLFWGCFIALITTAFAFISRMFLIDTWAAEFNLDPAQQGQLAGIGIWPFAVSIIGFSLIIDRIGYKTAMFISFLGYAIWTGMAVAAFYASKGGDKATGYNLLYWGSLILGLSNGTVEAYINPVVATMFSRNKTKWLNILHAGWPGGLVLAGLVTIGMDYHDPHTPWSLKLGIIAVPAVIFVLILLPLKFPAQERVAAGVSYRDMLGEFGIMGALVVGFLVVLQLMSFFSGVKALQADDGTLNMASKAVFIVLGLAIVAGFAVYTKSFGRGFMFVMIIIMMPLATTEIGTDGWITSIMEVPLKKEGFHAGWVLVYTSFIMMVLRFFAGPIIHKLSPLGLLAACSVLAIGGLIFLSGATTLIMIFVAATLYAFGKTFFWPTMLGVVSDQTPRGGALTLNALGGIGMLAVGVLGFPFIGTLQADKKIDAIAATAEAKEIPGLVAGSTLNDRVLETKRVYEIIPYKTVDDKKLAMETALLPKEKQEKITTAANFSAQKALMNMAMFPGFMLLSYLILLAYFKSRGGYRPVHIHSDDQVKKPGLPAADEY